MASFSVTANNYLRSLYSGNRNLVNNSERGKVAVSDLGKADAKALKRGISSLSSFDYEEENSDETKFYKTLKAFADSYNNTISSSDKISLEDPKTKKVLKEMKKLKEEYGDQLETYGIGFDKKGYMTINSVAMDEIDVKSFKSILGEDSEFLKDLDKISKKLSRRINYLV